MRTAFERHSPLIRSPLRRAHKHSLLARPQPHPSTAGQVQCQAEQLPLVAAAYRAAFELRLGAAQTLQYGGLSWGDAEAGVLARVVRSGVLSSLQVLRMGNNAIGDHGAISLASALTSDTASALRRLVLNNNALGDAGATAIANALGGGHMLRIEAVDLGHNHIGGGASDLPSDLPSASLAGPDLMFVVVAMWQWGLRR
jgi:hypothetical protein